jgi:hypothetical protein
MMEIFATIMEIIAYVVMIGGTFTFLLAFFYAMDR